MFLILYARFAISPLILSISWLSKLVRVANLRYTDQKVPCFFEGTYLTFNMGVTGFDGKQEVNRACRALGVS